ncbi:MAG: hypothetical protein FRX49_05413 [Trebouxia sp. A1-2]|nr:MAG: hypothetical protein FRX49_05413 [Trebouxia sp. A1-2]
MQVEHQVAFSLSVLGKHSFMFSTMQQVQTCRGLDARAVASIHGAKSSHGAAELSACHSPSHPQEQAVLRQKWLPAMTASLQQSKLRAVLFIAVQEERHRRAEAAQASEFPQSSMLSLKTTFTL